jgi:hypothetical protein
MYYAKLNGQIVTAVIDTQDNPIEDMFEPSYAAQCVPCNASVKQGHVYESATGTFSPPKEPEPTIEELTKKFTDAVQAHLDAFARTRNYDGIMSAATYATSTVPKFKAEGRYAVEARDTTWAKGYEILDEVLSGQRPMPTIDEVIAELPPLAWPEVAT